MLMRGVVTTQIPDLNEEVSFCVDDGTQSGPHSMRSIIDSVRSGERPDDVLVWWSGEAEWLPFNVNTTLMTLMAELPPLRSTSQTDGNPPAIDPDSAQSTPTEEASFPAVGSDVDESNADDDDHSLSSLFGATAHAAPEETSPSQLDKIEETIEALSQTETETEIDPDSEAEPDADEDVAIVRADFSFDDEQLADHFDMLVSSSQQRREDTNWAREIDRVLASGVTDTFADAGLTLLDASVEDDEQDLRFEEKSDGSRIDVKIRPVQPLDPSGRADVDIVVSWGQRVPDASIALVALTEERKAVPEGVSETGEIVFEPDVATGFAFAQVEFVIDAQGYVSQDLSVDGESVSLTMTATVQALRAAWQERFETAKV